MRYWAIGILGVVLVGCGGNDNNPQPVPETPAPTFRYQLVVTNITNGQPFSPVVAMLSDATFKAWDIGQPASVELEQLAEGGDGSLLLNSQSTNPQVAAATPVAPGAQQTLELSTEMANQHYLTLATMLVNTNDAFSGTTQLDLSHLNAGDSKVYLFNAYDAGTENNSESTGTMPGPADGGEGFNAIRDDLTSVVTYHSGVVGREDGVPDSALNQAHRFDNPVLQLVITRL